MARLPDVTREQLQPKDQYVYDEIVASRGGVRGPYGALLHSPGLAARVAATGAYVRFESDLPEPLKEVVVLATAHEIDAQYVFTQHARLARQAGVSDDTIRDIAHGKASQSLSGDDELVLRYTQELLRDRKVSDGTYSSVIARFGVQGTVDLTGLIGHYLLVGQFIAAFEVELGPDVAPELPSRA